MEICSMDHHIRDQIEIAVRELCSLRVLWIWLGHSNTRITLGVFLRLKPFGSKSKFEFFQKIEMLLYVCSHNIRNDNFPNLLYLF